MPSRWLRSFFAEFLIVAFAVSLIGYGAQASRHARAADAPAWSEAVVRRPGVRNVIVLVGDGMGFNHVAAGDLYNVGRPAPVYESYPVKAAVSTYPYGGTYSPKAAWGSFTSVLTGSTDSAAAATALSTGHKTRNGYIGIGPDGKRLRNIIETAHTIGRATGVVTSVPLSHATPAGFAAHQPSRNGISAIANEMLRGGTLDVVIGCGNPWYDDAGRKRSVAAPYDWVGGRTTWDGLVAGKVGGDTDGNGHSNPFRLVQTRAEVRALASGATPARLAVVPQVWQTLQERRPGDVKAAPYKVPMNANVPTLAEETLAALNTLDEDPDGFFLMVEGGAIDWASHSNQSGRMIEELDQFNATVRAVDAWVNRHADWSDTLVIVTADHETGYLTGRGSGQTRSGPVWVPLSGPRAGVLSTMKWNASGHTNSLVPVYGKGAMAFLLYARLAGHDPVRGDYVDNTTVADTLFTALGLDTP